MINACGILLFSLLFDIAVVQQLFRINYNFPHFPRNQYFRIKLTCESFKPISPSILICGLPVSGSRAKTPSFRTSINYHIAHTH